MSSPTAVDGGSAHAERSAPKAKATIYRLVTPEHNCPYGLKSIDLLRRHGFEIEDHHLETEEEADALRHRLGVATTPQTFIDGELIGTLDDLRRYVGEEVPDSEAESYRPVVTLFAVMFLMAVGAASVVEDQPLSARTAEWFIAFTMCGLGYLKLRDIESFSTMFLNYDLLARRWVRYSYIYPYAETGAGLLMIPPVLTAVSVPVAFFIGTVGAVSVVKAVYFDKRELTCACAGGDSRVPLGFVSLTENLAMAGMAIWMAATRLI
jgi:glutaredoxin